MRRIKEAVDRDIAQGKPKVARQDADDSGRSAVKNERTPDYLRIAVKLAPPERVAEDHAILTGRRIRVLEDSAHQGTNAKQPKHAHRDSGAQHGLGAVWSPHQTRAPGIHRRRDDRLGLSGPPRRRALQ